VVARVQTSLLEGIDALPCEVEVDVDRTAIHGATVVGLPDTAVRESLERVRAAMANAGYPWPQGKVLINLAPADIKKEGPCYDLPIAVGLLIAQGVIPPKAPAGDADVPDVRSCLVLGELALDGRIRPVRGCLATADLARQRGLGAVVVPAENGAEAAIVSAGAGGVRVFACDRLEQVVGVLSGRLELEPVPPVDVEALLGTARAEIDFAEVRGQEAVKRALTIAAAGAHNLVMLGPAGTGKTMMAKALPGILPPMSREEALEVTRIYSAAGTLPADRGLVTTRPVRTPHHTASAPAIVGGGKDPRPGEITLAHRGVLFLDELPEFPRGVLETLRQPMEDRVVTIARASATVKFPASFMLLAAMNPTPKGDLSPGEVGRREMDKYLARLSGPLLDRIDMHVEAPAVPWKELSGAPRGTGSAELRERVARARDRQAARQGEGRPNALLSGKELDRLCALDEGATALLGQAIQGLGLSARAYDKIRRVSRTIADLAGSEAVSAEHVAEAVQYRLLDRRV
jgi:magnesium chelatase family protein